MDEGHPSQVDIRELPKLGKPLTNKVGFQSPLLAAATVQRLAAFIDDELTKPRAERTGIGPDSGFVGYSAGAFRQPL